MKVHGIGQALSSTLQKRHKVWADATNTSFQCYIYSFPDPWGEFSWDLDLITSDSEPHIQTLRHFLFLAEDWGSHWKHCFGEGYFAQSQELQGNPYNFEQLILFLLWRPTDWIHVRLWWRKYPSKWNEGHCEHKKVKQDTNIGEKEKRGKVWMLFFLSLPFDPRVLQCCLTGNHCNTCPGSQSRILWDMFHLSAKLGTKLERKWCHLYWEYC